FPLMSPSFMRVFNEAQIKKINKDSVPNIENVRYDIVAETAFNLCEIATVENKTIDDIIDDSKRFKKIVLETAESIWTSGSYSKSDLKIEKPELNEIRNICANILEFIQLLKKEKVEFK